jgi:hypothetical protein
VPGDHHRPHLAAQVVVVEARAAFLIHRLHKHREQIIPVFVGRAPADDDLSDDGIQHRGRTEEFEIAAGGDPERWREEGPVPVGEEVHAGGHRLPDVGRLGADVDAEEVRVAAWR